MTDYGAHFWKVREDNEAYEKKKAEKRQLELQESNANGPSDKQEKKQRLIPPASPASPPISITVHLNWNHHEFRIHDVPVDITIYDLRHRIGRDNAVNKAGEDLRLAAYNPKLKRATKELSMLSHTLQPYLVDFRISMEDVRIHVRWVGKEEDEDVDLH
jgi:hypothetical protein